jgi:hypothetical protein
MPTGSRELPLLTFARAVAAGMTCSYDVRDEFCHTFHVGRHHSDLARPARPAGRLLGCGSFWGYAEGLHCDFPCQGVITVVIIEEQG